MRKSREKEVGCRLLPDRGVPAFDQYDAFSSGGLNIRELDRNEPALCKTDQPADENENAAAAGPRNGAEITVEAIDGGDHTASRLSRQAFPILSRHWPDFYPAEVAA